MAGTILAALSGSPGHDKQADLRQLRFDFRFEDFRFDLRFPPLFFFGTFLPLRRASDRPMAIACLRLLTFFLLRPLLSVPFLRLRIARSTLLEAPFEYFRAMVFDLQSDDEAFPPNGRPDANTPGPRD